METISLTDKPALQDFLNKMENGWVLCTRKNQIPLAELAKHGYLEVKLTPTIEHNEFVGWVANYRKIQGTLF